MARKRKQTRPAAAALAELPRDTKELTPEEAEAAKGGWFYWSLSPSQQAEDDDIIHVFGPADESLSPERKA